MKFVSILKRAGVFISVKMNPCSITCAILLLFLFGSFATYATAQSVDFTPLCQSEAGGNVRNVSSCAGLSTALSNANPGDIVILANGNYTCDQVLSRSGTINKPIIIRAATPRLATFVNASVTISGNYNVLANLTFNNSGVQVTGHYNRITGNKFQNNAGALRAAVTVDRGNSNRIDHNEVVDYGVGHRGFRILPASAGNNTAKNNVIDRNYLHRSLGPTVNGADGIQLGANPSHTYEQLNTIVEYNLIEQWEIDGEMISNKSSKNIIRFNTLANSHAHGSIRHGSFVDVISNHFINVTGLIVHGDDHRIIGNVVENGALVIRNGDISQSQMAPGVNGHPAARRALVAANKVISGEICVGCRTPGGDASNGVAAMFTDLRENNGKITLLQHQNTVQSASYNGTVLPAVRLFPQSVGPNSPDVCHITNFPTSPTLLKVQ